MLDAVPLDAELIVESTDSTILLLFDSLLFSDIRPPRCPEHSSMTLVSLPSDDKNEYVWLEKPEKGGARALSGSIHSVEAVEHQLRNPNKIQDNADFKRLQATLGQNVKAHLYYRDDAGWAALDVLPDKKDLMLNGYALAADSTSRLRPLKYQRPVKNSIVNILPFDTRLMLHYGMSDYASYWQSFCDVEQVKTFNKKYGTNVETKLLEFLSEVSYNVICDKRHEIFVGRMNDPSAVIRFMEQLSGKTGVVSSQNYQGYVLYDLGEKNVVPAVFGPTFKSFKRCCYAIVDQYLVMASGFEPLKELITCYRSGRTLDMSENFRAFQRKMLETSNVTLYATGKGNRKMVCEMVGGPVSRFLEKHPEVLEGYQAVALQLAASKDLVYTNVCLSHGVVVNDEKSVRWKVNLDAPLKGKPYIVEDHASPNYNVVAFDSENNMYLIDCDGRILWKKQLEEAPMSQVFTVDCENNGQLQLLFNTAHTIQLIDRSGDRVEGYPIRLPFEAANGLVVFDYQGNKDYRILLCGTDKLVYNYDLKGEEVEGWNRHRSEDLVKRPLQHIVADDKDYLIVADVSGGVRILDRQGRIRIPLPSDMQKSPHADIYANVTNRSKGLFLTSDQEGKLMYVTADGQLNRTDFGAYSKDHFFLYEDFNGDKDPDFIYLDHNDLHVYDRFRKELFSHHFDTDITVKPVFFNITRNKRLLGIVSAKAREIYLIDKKGKMIVNSGLVGETPFAVGSLHNDQEINLVTGVGNALFNYAIH